MKNEVITPNTPNVVSEDFDGEIILVNLTNGNYYSLRNSGARIWKLIESRTTFDIILEAIEHQYDIDNSATVHVDSFITELLEQQLIRTEPMNGHRYELTHSGAEDRQPFEAPVLEVYSDMQDLLLLDPIHDVDEETGWPQRPDDDPES